MLLLSCLKSGLFAFLEFFDEPLCEINQSKKKQHYTMCDQTIIDCRQSHHISLRERRTLQCSGCLPSLAPSIIYQTMVLLSNSCSQSASNRPRHICIVYISQYEIMGIEKSMMIPFFYSVFIIGGFK